MSRLFILLSIFQVILLPFNVSAQTFAERVQKAYKQKVDAAATNQISARKGGKGSVFSGKGGKGTGSGKGMMSRKSSSPSPSTISPRPTEAPITAEPTQIPSKTPTSGPTDTSKPTESAFPTPDTLTPTKGKGKGGMMGGGSGKGGMMGKGGMKSKKSKKTFQPTVSVAPTPTPPPTILNEGCIPTVGPCIDNVDDLANTLDFLSDGDVVALCGNGNNIVVDRALELNADAATLCCGSENCLFLGTGNDAILRVFGNSVTIANVTFINGASTSNGGNVAVTGGGSIRIINSSFRNGVTERSGGNLYVRTSGSVSIENSYFATGAASDFGGGVAIASASMVSIIASLFLGNVATDGGGLSLTKDSHGSTGQVALIQDSIFLGNAAEVGGGFWASELGQLPALNILNSEFSGNTASVAAGAGAIVDSLDNLDLTLMSNMGSRNIGAEICEDFIAADSDIITCITANETFP